MFYGEPKDDYKDYDKKDDYYDYDKKGYGRQIGESCNPWGEGERCDDMADLTCMLITDENEMNYEKWDDWTCGVRALCHEYMPGKRVECRIMGATTLVAAVSAFAAIYIL